MLSNTGNSILFLNLLLSLAIIYFAFQDLKKDYNFINKKIYYLSLTQSTFIIICFFTLIAGFLISDFSISAVYQNSHSLKPILYKISGTWGNHEGSLLIVGNNFDDFFISFFSYKQKACKNIEFIH